MPPRRPSGSAAAPDAGVAGAGAGAPAEVGILPGGGRVSSNAYASGANQNAGVFRSVAALIAAAPRCETPSTHFLMAFALRFPCTLAGNVLTDRRTTRVLAPAGGKSSIVFG
jgi:hypothetical protein